MFYITTLQFVMKVFLLITVVCYNIIRNQANVSKYQQHVILANQTTDYWVGRTWHCVPILFTLSLNVSNVLAILSCQISIHAFYNFSRYISYIEVKYHTSNISIESWNWCYCYWCPESKQVSWTDRDEPKGNRTSIQGILYHYSLTILGLIDNSVKIRIHLT